LVTLAAVAMARTTTLREAADRALLPCWRRSAAAPLLMRAVDCSWARCAAAAATRGTWHARATAVAACKWRGRQAAAVGEKGAQAAGGSMHRDDRHAQRPARPTAATAGWCRLQLTEMVAFMLSCGG
jgi:hypothetical protein